MADKKPKTTKPWRYWTVVIKDGKQQRTIEHIKGRAMTVSGRGDLLFHENPVTQYGHDPRVLTAIRGGIWLVVNEQDDDDPALIHESEEPR